MEEDIILKIVDESSYNDADTLVSRVGRRKQMTMKILVSQNRQDELCHHHLLSDQVAVGKQPIQQTDTTTTRWSNLKVQNRVVMWLVDVNHRNAIRRDALQFTVRLHDNHQQFRHWSPGI